jgi:ParB family protein of integrating conjugative element (PFGI_1 class)
MDINHNRATGNDSRGQLFEVNFGSARTDPLMPSEVTISYEQIALTLKLNEIKSYDKNPRRTLNPAYERIKESIRSQRGLNNPFNVTRRPGDEKYMVQSGGNTRLAILRELYSETSDEVFNTVQCFYVPWTSESSVITAHLVENELRGDMALIDKAYAIQALRAELEHEQGITLSDKAFIKQVTERGFKLSLRQANRLHYALELDQVIPIALREGMTFRQLETIKSTEKAYQQYCSGKTEQMPALFANQMAEHDGDYFNFEQVRHAIDRELSQLISVPSNRISLEIDALLFEFTKKQETRELHNDLRADSLADSTHFLLPMHLMPQAIENHEAKGCEDRPVIATETIHTKTRSQNLYDSNSKQSPTLDYDQAPNEAILESIDLLSLHQQGFEMAAQIAQAINMEHLILPRTKGMGFVIEKPAIPPQNFTEWGIWWLLLGLSEQGADEKHILLWQDTELYQLYASDAEGGENVRNFLSDPPNLQLFPHQVLNDSNILNDSVLNELIRLIENCRTLRKHFSSGVLWPEP